MPAGDPDVAPAPVHESHGTGTPHTAHRCTCPGGCCSTTPVGLLAHTLRATFAAHVRVIVHVAEPGDTIELAVSPQLALPRANAPPPIRTTLDDAAQYTT